MEPRALNGVRSVAEPLAMSSVIHHTIFKHHEAQNLRMVVTVSSAATRRSGRLTAGAARIHASDRIRARARRTHVPHAHTHAERMENEAKSRD